MGVKLDWIAEEGECVSFEKGQAIFSEGEPGTVMYVIMKGVVELKVGDTLVEQLTVGEPFGEMALIDRAPRNATAVARTACSLAPVEASKFRSLVRLDPDFAIQIMKVIVDRLRTMDSRSVHATPPPAAG